MVIHLSSTLGYGNLLKRSDTVLDKTLENELNQIIAKDKKLEYVEFDDVMDGIEEDLIAAFDEAINHLADIADEINEIRAKKNLVPLTTVEINLGGEED